MIAYLPDVLRGEMRAVRLLRLLGSAWFSIGPAVVLSAAPGAGAADAAPLVLVAALASQLLCDFGASAVMERLLHGATLREQLARCLGLRVDIALTPVGPARRRGT